MLTSDLPDWRIDGRDWPNREASRFVSAGGLRWHVQVMGDGPVLLLAHGTGAATHSWRDLLPLLAPRFTLIAPDLPGHGFTGPLPGRATLPAMAGALAALLKALDLPPPAIAAGHSAGAAVLARLAMDGVIEPKALVAFNGALTPFREGQNRLFTGLARLLVANPIVPRLFSWTAGDRRRVEKLMRDTGSAVDARGIELYARLLRRPGHVAGALAMMAEWELEPLLRALPDLRPRLYLLAASRDRAVPPDQAERVARRVPGAIVLPMPGLGHCSHEERPDLHADLLTRIAGECGIIEGPRA